MIDTRRPASGREDTAAPSLLDSFMAYAAD